MREVPGSIPGAALDELVHEYALIATSTNQRNQMGNMQPSLKCRNSYEMFKVGGQKGETKEEGDLTTAANLPKMDLLN